MIVRDTVQKTLITQFRAHKSPIASLCFDPSGTLLVTASVQGHNINVFQIIPRCSGNSSGADNGASYIHLYRLQRGVTNAVRTFFFGPSFFEDTASGDCCSDKFSPYVNTFSGYTGHQFQ